MKMCCQGTHAGAVVPYTPWTPGAIQLDVWRYELRDADDAPTGHVVRERGRKVSEVGRDLRNRLEAEGLLDEGLTDMTRFPDSDDDLTPESEWPDDYKWIACFAVTGGSEGHYTHIELVGSWRSGLPGGKQRRRLIFLTKTFAGMDRAYRIAQRCAEPLGA